jgi:recombination protein RecT
MRSGQCQSLICEEVFKGQLVSKNKFTGDYVFDEDAKVSDEVIGYMAYFRLTNGFEKYEYMTIDEVKAHAQKFSQTYRKGAGIWRDHFSEMAKKTVLKRLITKWAPKSIDMQRMALFDQAVVKGDIERGVDEAEVDYMDNSKVAAPSEFTEFSEVEDTTTSAE